MSSYLGNPNLKDVNVKIQWTPYRISEYEKCEANPEYFIKKYIKIVTLDEGVTDFELWPFQEKLISVVHSNRFTICKMPRQSGKSTTMVAYFLHYIIFNKHKKIGILANKRDTAVELLSRLQLAFELLPQWLQQGVKTWNKTSIELENGCRVEAHATSGQSVRGKSFNIVFLDEFAHIEPKLADKFWTSTYPVITAGKSSKVIIVSTPNGMNLYYEMWEKAELAHDDKRWNQFNAIEVHYTEVPRPGFVNHDVWAEQIISTIGQDRFDQEFGCEFLGSGSTLIAGRFLKTMITTPYRYSQSNLDVWEDPIVEIDETNGIKKPHAYIICVDVANGKQLDYSAFVVVDVTYSPYKIVAKYRSNLMPAMTYADVIYPVAQNYNNAFVLIELDGPGNQVADDLHFNKEYDNIMLTATSGRAGQILSTGFGTKAKNAQRGVKMTAPVRRTGCLNLKNLIENKKLLIFDDDIKKELSSFSLHGERYEAEEGKHDDLVMCLVTFGWLITNKHFRDLVDQRVRQSLVEDYSPILQFDTLPKGLRYDGITKTKLPEKDKDMPGDLWTVAGGDAYNRYIGQELNRLRYDKNAFDRLSSHYGWSQNR